MFLHLMHTFKVTYTPPLSHVLRVKTDLQVTSAGSIGEAVIQRTT